MQKQELWNITTLYTKIILKWKADQNGKPKPLVFSEENKRYCLCDPGFTNIKHICIKSRHWKNERTVHNWGENICNLMSSQELASLVHKECSKIKNKKITQ